ncbi:complexed with Cdc5 protein Cwf16 [Schizosaccharomyces japonicus yFS275]|uniref:Complexed with Cdc5 protein Cwf16 n=1 Tax=Schizosaccharomyces japonicus (strain yFS275 / FY16936) TaxID=402676 RepID=B6K474_SCHJY|nr:complexed with Cdc5 protein Cwf16 [Schizosaccharomyces japonicus yFS275]EEB08281.2 complexed with Cdc5 protein Cwf16 [Schizosaccharomyces japonicus yFS275]
MGRYYSNEFSDDVQRKKKKSGKNIIRFELPYSIWCSHCDNLLTQGTRYNASKTAIGKYYTTTIWSFQFRCHLCSNEITIETDPKAKYRLTSGAKPRAEPGLIDTKPLEKDEALVAIERNTQAQQANSIINALIERNERQWADNYEASQKLRKEFRTNKRKFLDQRERDKKFTEQAAFSVPLVTPSPNDQVEAASLVQRAKGKEKNYSLNEKRTNDSVFKTKSKISKNTALARIARNTFIKRDPFGTHAPVHRKKQESTQHPFSCHSQKLVNYDDESE